jgi:hypothetical protein
MASIPSLDASVWPRLFAMVASSEAGLLALLDIVAAVEIGVTPTSTDLASARGAIFALLTEYARLREGLDVALSEGLASMSYSAMH